MSEPYRGYEDASSYTISDSLARLNISSSEREREERSEPRVLTPSRRHKRQRHSSHSSHSSRSRSTLTSPRSAEEYGDEPLDSLLSTDLPTSEGYSSRRNEEYGIEPLASSSNYPPPSGEYSSRRYEEYRDESLGSSLLTYLTRSEGYGEEQFDSRALPFQSAPNTMLII
jgi:hypothetical protein